METQEHKRIMEALDNQPGMVLVRDSVDLDMYLLYSFYRSPDKAGHLQLVAALHYDHIPQHFEYHPSYPDMRIGSPVKIELRLSQ